MPKVKAGKGTPRPASGPVTLLVGTRKGAFFIRSDRARRSWTLAGPHFLGQIVNHLVLDPRDGKTLLCAVRAGHLGPTVFRSTDFGRAWKEAQRPPAFPKAVPGEKGLAVEHVFWLTPGHASQPGAWYAGVSPPGLFRSEDGGVTWEGVAGFNANPMRSAWIGGEENQGPPGGATLHSVTSIRAMRGISTSASRSAAHSRARMPARLGGRSTRVSRPTSFPSKTRSTATTCTACGCIR